MELESLMARSSSRQEELRVARAQLEEAKEMKNFLLEEQKRSREKEHLMSRLVEEQKRSARVEELKSRLAGLRAGNQLMEELLGSAQCPVGTLCFWSHDFTFLVHNFGIRFAY